MSWLRSLIRRPKPIDPEVLELARQRSLARLERISSARAAHSTPTAEPVVMPPPAPPSAATGSAATSAIAPALRPTVEPEAVTVIPAPSQAAPVAVPVVPDPAPPDVLHLPAGASFVRVAPDMPAAIAVGPGREVEARTGPHGLPPRQPAPTGLGSAAD